MVRAARPLPAGGVGPGSFIKTGDEAGTGTFFLRSQTSPPQGATAVRLEYGILRGNAGSPGKARGGDAPLESGETIEDNGKCPSNRVFTLGVLRPAGREGELLRNLV